MTSQEVLIIIAVVNMVLTLATTVWLFVINGKTNKIDKLEDKLTAAAREAVDTRFALLAAKFEGSVASLNVVVTEMKERLTAGDGHFKNADEKGHKLELKISQAEHGVREWALNTFASAEDLSDLQSRLTKLEGDFRACQAGCKS